MNGNEMDLPAPPDVRGLKLDGGEVYTISASENAALCRSTGVEPLGDGRAHLIYYYIATQLGMGPTVAGLCEACEFDVADGPMIVESTVRFHNWPMVDTPYRVTGEIVGLTRKRSRKLGVMDMLEYRLTLSEADRAVAEVMNRWVLPRKSL